MPQPAHGSPSLGVPGGRHAQASTCQEPNSWEADMPQLAWGFDLQAVVMP